MNMFARRELFLHRAITWLSLVVFFHDSLAEFSCHRPAKDLVTRWHETTSNHTIDWRIDRVCSTFTECFGYQPNGDTEEHVQLCPIQIQFGDELYIRSPPTGSLYSTNPVNVTLDEWIYCPNRDYPASQQIFSTANDTKQLIYVPQHFLRPGVVYIAEAPNGAFSNCRYGLRVAVTVKRQNCAPNNESGLCSGHGVCGATLLQSTYSCMCDDPYRGSYCGEYNTCVVEPCRNEGTCVDVTEGDTGRNFTCFCTAGFAGNFTNSSQHCG